jgi:RNA polymerase-associated protein RTF1
MTKEAAGKKRSTPTSKKPQPNKKAKAGTDGDEELARKLSGRRESARDRDANKAKSKKAAALAALKKEKKIQQQQQRAEESSEDSLDFGDDDDDDSDDDYEEAGGLKPWQQKQKDRAAKSASLRLDKADDEGEEEEDDEMEIDDDEAPGRRASGARATSEKISTPEVEAGLDDFSKVTIPRRRLARWCNEPFFAAAILECFVRLFIGEDDSGAKVYRLCEIVDVKTGPKTYKLPTSSKAEKPISTNKQLRLKFGKSEKDFPLSLISDTAPTEEDVQKYLTNQKNNRLEVLTRRAAVKLRRLQDSLVQNYTYTNEDIERNLQARKKQGKGLANLGLEQTKVAIAVQAARDSVYEAERRLAEAKKQLFESSDKATASLEEGVKEAERGVQEAKELLAEKENEERILNNKVEDRKRRLAQRKGDVDWAKVNERAIQINQRVDREALKIKQGPSVAGSGKKDGEFNPYARRRVKPKILWEVGQGKDDENADIEGITIGGEEKKESHGVAHTKDEQTDATPNLVHESSALVSESKPSAPFTESHQFSIDEEGLVTTSGYGSSKKGSSSKNRARKGLSLSEYLEQKATGTL